MKQKGFTLIELLAVIVILAIIAIIAVPVILNVIEKSKIGAAEQSAQGYIDAVEKQIVTNKVKNENLIEEGEYTKSQLDEKNVKIKGEITDALVVVGEKGRVTQGRFCINGYSIDYDGKKATKNTEANYCSEMNSIVENCPYEINQVFNFDYTGDIQEFTPECSGKYKLEVWGAQGGNANNNCSYRSNGGYGGYSFGTYGLKNNVTMFIIIGGQGQSGNGGYGVTGGYNGGGDVESWNSGKPYSGSGGGATHIALRTGLLSTLESYKSDILIVAGGGGGGYCTDHSDTSNNWAPGQHGGGYIGGQRSDWNTWYSAGSWKVKGPSGGTQSEAGLGGQVTTNRANGNWFAEGTSGNFGQGGTGGNCSASSTCGAGGGGSGYYGGGGGSCGHNGPSVQNGGAGGSGYIGNLALSDKQMYMYNQGCTASNDEATKTTCTTNVSGTPTSNYAKEGNGYARITYLGK